MVEVEIILLSAKNALSFVTLPHFQFHSRWNHSRVRKRLEWGGFDVQVLRQFEMELEN